MKKVLVTGSSGLWGSESVHFYAKMGWEVYGIDVDIRGYLFGSHASTAGTNEILKNLYPNFHPHNIDIRDYVKLAEFFKKYGPFDLIKGLAAQPSHEWSVNNLLEDFAINAMGTVNLLEAYRHYSPEAVFIYASSSKVYGDSVNRLPFVEYETRYDLPKDNVWYEGVDETYGRLDGELHSPFGSSKACGDIMAKEFATYFNLPIAIFRPVCISGSLHKGDKLHGYLAYVAKCVAHDEEYIINGFKGKQLRDNIHAYDLVTASYEVFKNPQYSYGEAYNLGAGRKSCNSIIEAFAQTEKILNKTAKVTYSDQTRRGDHIWCVYDTTKFKQNYPDWDITYDNDRLMMEICSQYM